MSQLTRFHFYLSLFELRVFFTKISRWNTRKRQHGPLLSLTRVNGLTTYFKNSRLSSPLLTVVSSVKFSRFKSSDADLSAKCVHVRRALVITIVLIPFILFHSPLLPALWQPACKCGG